MKPEEGVSVRGTANHFGAHEEIAIWGHTSLFWLCLFLNSTYFQNIQTPPHTHTPTLFTPLRHPWSQVNMDLSWYAIPQTLSAGWKDVKCVHHEVINHVHV